MTEDDNEAAEDRQKSEGSQDAKLTDKERKLIEDTIQRHRSTLEELSKR